jgi:hypothetical protein
MKRQMLSLVALGALCGGALFGQNIAGTWQGKLGGQGLRIVIKVTREITKDDKVNYSATGYSIDQSGQPFAGGPMTVQGASVKMPFPGIGGVYEGKLSEDGKLITGTWKQGDQPVPMNLELATDATAWAIPEPPPRLKPMAADAHPAFEVATINPTKAGEQAKAVLVRGRHFGTINQSLTDLIAWAYGVHAKQIVGAPSWMETAMWDIDAEPDKPGQPSLTQWKEMLQKLLADSLPPRFS